MISWMQRHRKYLVVTIWISTIAFIGAGFVGWGQYSYGDRASAVAKVGDVEITARELQSTYSNLYNQYNQLFQGNFDEAQAKSFGLDKMALKQLIDQAMVLNLAESYGLQVSDKEVLDAIASQRGFFKNGSFDKETYHKALKANNLHVRDFESDVRKALLIEKTLALFPKNALPIENETLSVLSSIADKVSYKVLTADEITVIADDAKLKSYWEMRQQNYMTLPSYKLEVVTQPTVEATYDDAALKEHYDAKRSDFTDSEGKILPFEDAKADVAKALNNKATHKAALKQYIAFKKGQLADNVAVETLDITKADQPFGAEVFAEITELTQASPFLKPRKIGEVYKTIKLVSLTPSEPKSFEAARGEVIADYNAEQKQTQLIELAKGSVETFAGETTPFITRDYAGVLTGMNTQETRQFVDELFSQQTKRGYITLNNTKIVLFHILEQQLLKTPQTDLQNTTLRLKATLLDQGLLKTLESKYAAEIYIEGI
ncbi:MAG: peptidylprolyl isomerase [Sulfurimonadaceae bacterium]|nr:peptidylprolyl isomerase [Sulfurimonadaceae bacterium]